MSNEDKPMEFNPRPRLPQGCDQQGRYPEAAYPRIDDDEIRNFDPPQPEPWWHDWLLVTVALLVLVLVFAPLGA